MERDRRPRGPTRRATPWAARFIADEALVRPACGTGCAEAGRSHGGILRRTRLGAAMAQRKISRREWVKAVGAAGAATALGAHGAETRPPRHWDRETDVIVIGSGATGLPAAIVARESGADVMLLEAENHIGGHAICSGGNLPLGGGTSVQKKYGIEDSPDIVFRDLTDWSIVQTSGAPDYRYNDREIVRAFADHCTATFEWLVAHGVVF